METFILEAYSPYIDEMSTGQVAGGGGGRASERRDQQTEKSTRASPRVRIEAAGGRRARQQQQGWFKYTESPQKQPRESGGGVIANSLSANSLPSLLAVFKLQVALSLRISRKRSSLEGLGGCLGCLECVQYLGTAVLMDGGQVGPSSLGVI